MNRRDLIKTTIATAAAVMATGKTRQARAQDSEGPTSDVPTHESCARCTHYRNIALSGRVSMCVGTASPIYKRRTNSFQPSEVAVELNDWCDLFKTD